MASSDSHRSGLLAAGGVLSMLGGAFQILFGLIVVGLMIGFAIWGEYNPSPDLPWMPGNWSVITAYRLFPTWLSIVGLPALGLGIVAIIGGHYALRRRSFGMSLAGAVCALPTVILGILAVVFVALGRREFRAED